MSTGRRSFLISLLLTPFTLPRKVCSAVRNYKASNGQTGTTVRNYKSQAPVKPTVPPASSCPNGQCPRIRTPWIERRFGYTTPQHLMSVHGWSAEIVSMYQAKGLLDYLHGSPDSPRNPHTYG